MRWQEIDGWLTVEEGWTLRQLAKMVPPGGLIVEVGCWKGRSTAALALGSEGKRLVTIDHFRGDDPEHFADPDLPKLRLKLIDNLARCGMGDRVDVIEGESVEVAAGWHEPIDLLFLDGSHDYDSVRADVAAWWPHVRGAMVFHDYCPEWPGVVKAVDEAGLGGCVIPDTSLYIAYKETTCPERDD